MEGLLSTPLNYLPNYFIPPESEATPPILLEPPLEVFPEEQAVTDFFNFCVLYDETVPSEISQSYVEKIQKKAKILEAPSDEDSQELEIFPSITRNVRDITRKPDKFLTFCINATLIDCIHHDNRAFVLFKKEWLHYLFEYTGNKSSVLIPHPEKKVLLSDSKNWDCAGYPLKIKRYQPENLLAYNGESFAVASPGALTFYKDFDCVEGLSSVHLRSEPTAITNISEDWAISLKDRSILIFSASGALIKYIESEKLISQLKSNESYLISISPNKICYFYKKEENYDKKYPIALGLFFQALPSVVAIHESTVFFGGKRGNLYFFDLIKRISLFSYRLPDDTPILNIVPYSEGVLVATTTRIVFFTIKESRYVLDESFIELPSRIASISFMKKVGEKILIGGATSGNVSEIYEFSFADFPIGLKRKIANISKIAGL